MVKLMNEHLTHCKSEVMVEILEVRYTDLERERTLCMQLLAWAEETGDHLGRAFALVYLGDYYVAQNEGRRAGDYLLEAKRLTEEGGYVTLSLKLYSILGVYYELIADEQSSVQSYLEAIAVAHRLDDKVSESLIYNNLAFAFQRHHCYDEAMRYYEQAHEIQRDAPENPQRTLLLGNLVEVSVLLGRLEQAKAYIEEIERLEPDPDVRDLFRRRNWCCYYAGLGDVAQATYWAERVMEREADYLENRLSAFEQFSMLCHSMMRIGNAEISRYCLARMEDSCAGGGLDQQMILEDLRVQCFRQFEPQTRHAEIYARYYAKGQALKAESNATIVRGMKAKIALDQAIQQKEDLRSEQESLRQQAEMDELTGVYNRHFLEQTTRHLSQEDQAGSLGVVMVDADYFKEYNDFYGHMQGDEVLKTIAACLWENRVEGIYPCRYGGDEFTCVCQGLGDQAVERYVEAVCADLERRNVSHEKSKCSERVTVSIGYANEAGRDPQLLLQLADQALYESKQRGRNAATRKWAGEL